MHRLTHTVINWGHTLVACAFCLTPSLLWGEEIRGEVLSLDKMQVRIRITGQSLPRAGDSFEIFEEIPGVGRAQAAVGEISAAGTPAVPDAAGKPSQASPPLNSPAESLTVTGRILRSTASVRPGQQVAIDSPQPQPVDGVAVPILIARTAADAQAALSAAGFQVSLRLGIGAPEGVAPFTVYQQQPQYFTRAPRGSTVTVDLYAPAGEAAANAVPATPSARPSTSDTPTPAKLNPDSDVSLSQRIQGRWLCVEARWRGGYAQRGQGTELLVNDQQWHWIGVLPEPARWTLDESTSSPVADVQFAKLPDAARAPVVARGLNPTRFDGLRHRLLIELDGDRLTLAELDDPRQAPANLQSADWSFEFRRFSDRPNLNQTTPTAPDQTPSFGAIVADVNGYGARAAGVRADRGVFVVGVVGGTAAAEAGLQSGDVLLSLNDEPVDDYREFRYRVRAFRVGQEVSVTFQRGASLLTRSLRLVAQPANEQLQSDVRRQALAGAAWAQTMVGRWTQAAAEAGTDNATSRTGDSLSAADWFRRAADQGDADAQNLLGLLYERGEGVPRNMEQAVALYRRSAEQGHPDAQVNYGNLLNSGTAVTQDRPAAFDYYQRAAAQDSPRGLHNMAVCYEGGLGVPANPRAAWEGLLRAAAAGQAEACTGAGYCLARGVGVDADPAAAIDWYRLGADRGDLAGLVRLATAYREGNGVPRDDQQALKLMREAASSEFPYAMTMIGDMYRLGHGVEQNPQLAMEWFQKGAAGKDPQAHRMIGLMIRQGQGVRQDFEKARGWFEAASRLGDAEAEVELGKLYEQGQGVAPSRTEAIRHYRRAHEMGSESAAAKLRGLGVSP